MEIKEFIEKFADAIEAEAPETLTPQTKFRDLEEWSSLAALGLLAMADEEFDVELKAEDMRKAESIADLLAIIEAKQ